MNASERLKQRVLEEVRRTAFGGGLNEIHLAAALRSTFER